MERVVPASITEDVPLVGADGYHALWNSRKLLASRTGLRTSWIEHLLNRYGSLIHELLAMIDERPELREPLPGAEEYLRVEALYAATHEGARHLEDVLTRRTRISIEAWDRGLAAAVPAARLMAETLGWDAERRDREVDHYRRRVAAERDSQDQPDDTTADAARMGEVTLH